MSTSYSILEQKDWRSRIFRKLFSKWTIVLCFDKLQEGCPLLQITISFFLFLILFEIIVSDLPVLDFFSRENVRDEINMKNVDARFTDLHVLDLRKIWIKNDENR